MKSKQITTCLRCLMLTLLLSPSAALAASYDWPNGTSPCNTTFQYCMDGVPDGSTIIIGGAQGSTTVPGQSFYVQDKSLTVKGRLGQDVRFANAVNFTVSATEHSDQRFSLSHVIMDGATIEITDHSDGNSTYDIRDVQAGSIKVKAFYHAVADVNLYNNRFVGLADGGGGWLNAVLLSSYGSTMNATVFYNHIVSPLGAGDSATGSGISINSSGSNTSTFKVAGNVVTGNFQGGISVHNNHATTNAYLFSNAVACLVPGSSAGYGINLMVENGPGLNSAVVNNTVAGCRNGVTTMNGGTNNTNAMTGVIENNVLTGGLYGVWIDRVASGMTHDYNLINASQIAVVNSPMGSHTLTSPADLVHPPYNLRLKPSSPAIDSADAAPLFALLFTDTPVGLDADGLRRIKTKATVGAASLDRGAFEYGDTGLWHTVSASSSSYISTIHNPITNQKPSLDLFATPHESPDPNVFNVDNADHPFGTWYNGAQWTLFAEDTNVVLPANWRFNIFVPARSSGVFRVHADSSNTGGWTTRLDNTSINNQPDVIILANQNYDAGAAYNDHPIGVYYFLPDKKWDIANADRHAIAMGAGFSVYAQPPSASAFRVTAPPGGGHELVVDNPLLNHTPCARMFVTRIVPYNQSPTGNFDVFYSQDRARWYIRTIGDVLYTDSQFNVVVNPAQVEQCRDLIFKDGFER